ncbi:MAG: hypothetical protein Q8Q28_17025 [Pseudomonadota bacterium]|nr:hypothetical protein [Pseudomonadota bacterium]
MNTKTIEMRGNRSRAIVRTAATTLATMESPMPTYHVSPSTLSVTARFLRNLGGAPAHHAALASAVLALCTASAVHAANPYQDQIDVAAASQPNAGAAIKFSNWDDYKNKALQWLKANDGTVNSSHECHNHHNDVKHHGVDGIRNVTADTADANSVSSWFINNGTVVTDLSKCAGCATGVSACNGTVTISTANSDCTTASNTASYTQTTGVTMTGSASYGPAEVSVEGSVSAEKSTSSASGTEVCNSSADTTTFTHTYYEKYLKQYTLSGGATSLIKYTVPQIEYQVYCTYNGMSGTYHYGAYMDTSRMPAEYKNPVVGVDTSWDYVDEAAQMTVQSLQTPSCPPI